MFYFFFISFYERQAFMQLIIFTLAILIILLFFFLRPGRSSKQQRAPFEGRNYAHRGLYTANQAVPENSLPAFCRAADAGYGIELDVQLTRDGEVVVFHDGLLDRMCGQGLGKLEAHTLQELSHFSLAGTSEHIPLFADVLKAVNGRVPLIVEVKTTARYAELCEKALTLLRQAGGAFCMESFDVRAVRWMKKNAKDVLRGQLSCRMRELKSMPAPAAFFLSRLLCNFLGRPQFIAYGVQKAPFLARLAQSMAMTVVWTAHESDDTLFLEESNDAVIFEHYLPKPQYGECAPHS